MDKQIHFSSRTDDWTTPQWLFEALDSEFGFTLDPCCTHENAKCKRHFYLLLSTSIQQANILIILFKINLLIADPSTRPFYSPRVNLA
jgi:hypothetical protein